MFLVQITGSEQTREKANVLAATATPKMDLLPRSLFICSLQHYHTSYAGTLNFDIS